MVTQNSANNKTGASGTVLQGKGIGTASDFSTATYPSVAATSGNVMTSDGTNFGSTASKLIGARVWLDSQSASASSTVSLSGISATYNSYILIFSDLVLSATVSCVVQLNDGSGFKTSGYFSGEDVRTYVTTTGNNGNTTAGLMVANAGNTSTMGGIVYLINLTSGSGYALSTGTLTKRISATSSMCITGGSYDTPITTTSIRIATSSGTITTGKFTLYGLVE